MDRGGWKPASAHYRTGVLVVNPQTVHPVHILSDFSIEAFGRGHAGPLLYNVIFSVGLIPMALLMLWVRFVAARWPVFWEVVSKD
jgi:hypothetical protein